MAAQHQHAEPHLVQRWAANVHAPLLKKLPCIAEQKRQQQGADVCPVHVCIGQQHHLWLRAVKHNTIGCAWSNITQLVARGQTKHSSRQEPATTTMPWCVYVGTRTLP